MISNYIPCDKCDNGFIDNEEEMSTTKCDCLLHYQRETKLKILLDKANIPIKLSSNPEAVTLLDYSIEKDYVGDDKQGNIVKIGKYLKRFEEKYSSLNLYFEGKHSTQKSTLARYIGKELLKQGKSVRYILTDNLVRMVLDSQRDDDLKIEVNKIMNVDCLILDEFSTDKVTVYKSAYQIPFLTSFLKTRIETLRLSTIFCSNSPIDTLEKGFDTAIQRLISREVLDHSMQFTDNFESKSKSFKVGTLWD